MKYPLAKRRAWGLATFSIVVLLVGITFSILYIVTSDDYRNLLSHQFLVPFFTIAYAILGGLVASRQPKNSIGWLFLTVALLSSLNSLAVGYGLYGSAIWGSDIFPGANLADWLGTWVWIPGTLLPTVFVFFLFPDGQFLSPRWRLVAWPAIGGLILTVVGAAFHPGPIDLWALMAANPYGISELATPLEFMLSIGGLLLGIGLIGSIASLIVRFRRSRDIEREQMKWLVYAATLMVAGYAAGTVLWAIWPNNQLLAELSIILSELVILWVAVAAGIAILRYRLYDINLIINRTLVYGTLTAGVVGLYVLVVGGVSVGFQTNSNLVGLMLATALIALAFRPLQLGLQVSVDRLMYGPSVQPHVFPSTQPAPSRQRTKAVLEEPATISGPFLSGRWLNMVRVIWLLLVVLAIAFWLLGTIVDASEPLPSCLEIRCDPFDLSAQDLAAMQALNLPDGLITTGWIATNIGLGLVCFALTGLIFWRKSEDWMGLLASFALIFLGAIFFTESDDAVWRAYPAIRPALMVVQILGFNALMLLFFCFPDGQFIPRWQPARIVIWALIFFVAPFIAFIFRVTSLGTILILGMVFMGLGAQVYRYRRVSGPIQRRQTRWVLLGLAASLMVMLIWFVAAVYFPPTRPDPGRVYFLLFVRPVVIVLILLLPLTIAFSVLRYRLWDINIVVNRALVYGALTAVIVALYVLLVGGLGALFQSSGNLVVALLATGLAALLFQPLRERLQRAVNRLMYGERDDPVTVLTHLGQRLEATIAPEAALPTLVETIAQTLKLPYAAVELAGSDGSDLVAAHGLPIDDPLRLPLVYQTEVIGYLLLAPRSAGEAFSPADMKLLETIAYQAGTAVHAVQLTAALQQSRQRLVTAREEERRRLRRDLHDGLGPHLASQMLTIEAIGKLLKRDPAEAAALLQDLKQQTQSAVGDIRRLVYDLRPPTLDDLGLIGALRESAQQYRSNGLHLTINAPQSLPPLPAAVEVATYRIAREAMTNVVRHAGASQCEVRFRLTDNQDKAGINLEICDDGCGLSVNYRAGVGCQSMRERAAELGGRFSMETQSGGGTRVQAWLPL